MTKVTDKLSPHRITSWLITGRDRVAPSDADFFVCMKPNAEKRVSISIPDEARKRIVNLALQKGVPFQEVVDELLLKEERQSEAAITIESQQSSEDSKQSELLVRPLHSVLNAMAANWQKMNVEVKLPAHVWLMVATVVERSEVHGIGTIGDLISDIVFSSQQLRERWLEADGGYEAEAIPEAIKGVEETRKLKREHRSS